MKTGTRPDCFKAGPLLLALALLLSFCLPAGAEQGPDTDLSDITLVLAQDAVQTLNLKTPEGEVLRPRKAPEMKGRGFPDETGVEPDYRGVVGYMSLQVGWEVSRFNTFTDTPWYLPVFERSGDEFTAVEGKAIAHKTPVLVTDQVVREGIGHKFAGHLNVVRLDTMEQTWVDVTQFTTVDYWTLEISEAVKYGYCIAAYREKTRNEPIDRKAHRGALPQGWRVLMCYSSPPRYFSPDNRNNPLLGIVFRSRKESESYIRSFLFFNPEDLVLIY